ncbi:MAG: hypothetical protein K2H98_06555 [Duncaniella sp.]|nr:hypothetical protein [Duncaniella sp.]
MKEKVIGFLWQHLLLLVSLFVMTFGVALCVRSALGSSVISTIPFVMTLAGDAGKAPSWTIGEYTYAMNGILVGLQILLLRRKFEAVQLFQLVIGFIFGFLLDINMNITAMFVPMTLPWQMLTQAAGCSVLALGIAMELRCGSVTMPGEGLPVAISRVSGQAFARVKIYVDVTLVIIAVALGYVYFGAWLFNVVGTGTLFAMIYVGMAVKFLQPHMGWMDRALCYRPGFRRYIYGLARYIYRRRDH